MSTPERGDRTSAPLLSAKMQPPLIEADNVQLPNAGSGVFTTPFRFVRTETLVGLVLATLVSIAATGYALNDLFVYLPLTAYLRNPSLFPGDPLIQHLLRMP